MTWFDAPATLTHILSHVNPEKRAGRTSCGRYIEFWPEDIDDSTTPTCLQCVGAAPVVSPDYAVIDRWQDIVAHCAMAGTHLK